MLNKVNEFLSTLIQALFYGVVAGAVLLAFSTLLMGCGKVILKQGEKGAAGVNGASCSVTQVLSDSLSPGGALIECPNSTVLVSNGTNGTNGTDATPVEIIRPCGNNSPHAEVLLKQGSQVVALFVANINGDYARFATLVAHQAYGTTDGYSCSFKIDEHGNLI